MLLELNKVKVTPKERAIYLEELSNWDNIHGKLTVAILAGDIDHHDVAKMLKVEATSRRRLLVATRLLAVYHKLCKHENERRLTSALAR